MSDFRTYTWHDGRVPRPATGQTPVRNLRVPDHIWKPALEKAHAEGRTLTDVLIRYLIRYGSTPPRSRQDVGKDEVPHSPES